MKATYQICDRGNTALQTEIFSIPVSVAKLVAKELDCHPGSYWEANLVKPTRRAVRAKAEAVRVYTAGFSTGYLANALAAVGCEVTFAGDL